MTISEPVTAAIRTTDPATRIGVDLSRIVKSLMALRSRSQVPLPHAGIDYPQLPILFALSTGPSRVSDLATCIHSDISTVSRQVATLASLGLLHRVADPQDGRAQLISLTPDGARAIEGITTARAAWIRTMLADWSPQETEDLAQNLERLSASLTANLQRGFDTPDDGLP